MAVPQSKIFLFDPITQEEKEITYEYLSELTGRRIGDLRSYKSKGMKLAKEGWYILGENTSKEEYRRMINFVIKNEIWKECPGSCFEVSNYGRVRNKETGLIRKLAFNSGCSKIAFNVNGTRKMFNVHLLVMELFSFTSVSKKKDFIMHLDGNSYNCRFENLKYVTKEEFYSRKRTNTKGTVVYKIDLETGEILDEYANCSEAARENFIGSSVVAKAVRRKRSSFGFGWANDSTLNEILIKIKKGEITSKVTRPIYLIKLIDINTKQTVLSWKGHENVCKHFGIVKDTSYRWIKNKTVIEGKYILMRERMKK